MASISQGAILTSAIVLSSTMIYLAYSRKIIFRPSHISVNSDSQDSNKQILRSCLCSEEKKRERKKKKKVQFADNVKKGSDEARKEQRKENRVSRNCRDEIEEMRGTRGNRMALYNGILRDRVHRIECS